MITTSIESLIIIGVMILFERKEAGGLHLLAEIFDLHAIIRPDGHPDGYHVDIGSGHKDVTLVIGEALAGHIDSEIMEADEARPERMHSLLQFAQSAFGVCTEFQYHERVAYPDVIPMPKPGR